jgi:hypothetical protein
MSCKKCNNKGYTLPTCKKCNGSGVIIDEATITGCFYCAGRGAKITKCECLDELVPIQQIIPEVLSEYK